MRKGLIAALLWLGMLAGCNSEPVYQGVSFIAYNYTPWNIRGISVKDKGEGVASTMQVSPGGGEGSVTCCFTLKGTDFTVDWRGVDAELLRKHLHDGKADSLYFDRQGSIKFPAAEIPAGEGPLYLELHIYPDEHMELALSRKLLGQTRIPIVDTVDWLWREHRAALGAYRSDAELLRATAKALQPAWKKYRIEDKQDLRQYMLLYFTVASNFDSDPQVKAILDKPGRAPGDFARDVAALPPVKLEQIKAMGTPAGDKHV
ncbi:DUF3304 domain-containing protein [Achromobacter sp. LC458]|uniref:DUF3304 domain-containing protein n=1 Tax=Achromobacter sp. LC458 TaxID=1120623 RepID=UPI00062A4841|nr:DUF3304 domain-containing protein [Achromobacter sp. LC458]TRM51953.1 DUF3304 domain-containing protein [Achromobacter sp. LC458]